MAKIEEKSKEVKERIKKTTKKSYLYEMENGENGENGEEDILVNNIETEVQTDEEIEEDIKFEGNGLGVVDIDISDQSDIPEELEIEEEHNIEIPECIEYEEDYET